MESFIAGLSDGLWISGPWLVFLAVLWIGSKVWSKLSKLFRRK